MIVLYSHFSVNSQWGVLCLIPNDQHMIHLQKASIFKGYLTELSTARHFLPGTRSTIQHSMWHLLDTKPFLLLFNVMFIQSKTCKHLCVTHRATWESNVFMILKVFLVRISQRKIPYDEHQAFFHTDFTASLQECLPNWKALLVSSNHKIKETHPRDCLLHARQHLKIKGEVFCLTSRGGFPSCCMSLALTHFLLPFWQPLLSWSIWLNFGLPCLA